MENPQFILHLMAGLGQITLRDQSSSSRLKRSVASVQLNVAEK